MYSVFDLSEISRHFKSKEFGKIPRDIFQNLKCCVQRVRKGWCYRDLWNIDGWFLNVIPDMLDEFRDTIHGFPSRFLTKHPPSKEDSDKAFEKWKNILTEMAFLFREANEETCRKKNPYEKEYFEALDKFIARFGYNGKFVTKKDGTRVFIHKLSDIPKYRQLDENFNKARGELCEYREKCRIKALSMFSEYFNDLWD